MISKKFLGIMTAVFMLAGVGGTTSARNLGTSLLSDNSAFETAYTESTGTTVDLAIANEEKIIEMLKREGKITKNASYEEAHKVYMSYMKNAAKANEKVATTKVDRELQAKQNQRVEKAKFEQSKPDSNPKKVKILALLVDYSDYKHSSIQPGETDMYYKDYSHQHYQDMLFGSNGYEGPNGEKLISMKQFYEQQSGGSLDIEGTVAGWYTLPQTAKYYGEEYNGAHDRRAKNAVASALQLVAKDTTINLADFDNEDPYDLDGDENYNEPDGIIDYLMVLHAGVGQEAGGGSLGTDAIWSHSSSLGGLYKIPGTNYYGYKYTIEPEDGAAGVFAHEFGHNLGLPDEYDTNYTSDSGEPISYWSIMSSGSWTGKIPGTEPSGFSPYAKQMFQSLYGGNWHKQVTLDYNKLTSAGVRVDLRQADEQGQAVRINLPDRKHIITKPTSGQYAYWGGKGSDGTPMLTNMTTNVDLTGKAAATIKFKTWYDIEEGWDYASVQVREVGATEWTYLAGNITTTEGVEGRDVVIPYGITGTSDAWVDATFDLTAFAGKKVEVKIEYATDAYSFGAGLYVDDIQVVADNSAVFSDDVEGNAKFTFNGFDKSTGTVYAPNYYLVEWRNHHGVDTALAHISTLGRTFSYDPGMVVWYVDEYYGDNWVGLHPGNGYLGIVDADQKSVYWQWTDPSKAPLIASGKYQMHDAAFSKNKDSVVNVDLTKEYGRTAVDTNCFTDPNFDDSRSYLNSEIPTLGRDIPKLGLKIQIADQARDNSSATLIIKK